MNFFQAQDNARRKSWQLYLLFAAAIVSLIVLTNLLVALVYLWMGNYAYPGPMSFGQLLSGIPLQNWIFISVGVVGMVSVASLYKYLMIRGGGRTVAESLGGRLLTHATSDAKSRRALNVVEEMAIASGVPVPPVYLIDEPSINAFAAGFSPDDAVIGLNQGTIDHLSRDELQGVVGHEFSHILNGDMRINLRLMATLHGIVFLSLIGYTILRGAGHGRRSSNGGAPIMALGLGLLVIGYSGTFFGNLIKAAVSRQREYLADAASVQFTRNPSGIADALKKIGGLNAGSSIDGSAAAEASHLFFGQVREVFLNSLLSTHPPLDKRILAVEPRWDGEFTSGIMAGEPESDAGSADRAARGTAAGFAPGSSVAALSVQVDPDTLVETVGVLDQSSLNAAHMLIETTDSRLRDAAHDPWGCRALIYAMLLHHEKEIRDRQLDHLDTHADRGVPEYTARLMNLVNELDPPRKLTLVEMATPTLKTLSKAQYETFTANTVELIKADRSISLMEWVLHRILVKELKPHFEGHRRTRARHQRTKDVSQHAATLLSTLARFGHPGDLEGQKRAFAQGTDSLELPLALDESEDPNFSRLNEAIHALRALKPLAKPQILKACAATALADGHLSGTEGALLQGFSAALDCPLPPSIYALE